MREKIKKKKILLTFLALLMIFAFTPFVLPIQAKTNEGIKFLVLFEKENGERVSTPFAVILQPSYYKLTIEKSNGNGEAFFFVNPAFFSQAIIEWQNWWILHDAYTCAGLKYLIPEKPDFPNITIAIFGKQGLFVVNYTVVVFKYGELQDVYPVEVVLPNDFEPYEITYVKEQSFYAPINTTILPLKYHEKYIPSWWNGTQWISDFGEERIILTPFEYQWYHAKSLLLEKLWRQGLAKVDLKELEEVKWIVSHSESYSPLAWGTNIPLDIEEFKYYTHILQEIWG
jgi:hypothetical protein